jgi:hypothetical protein
MMKVAMQSYQLATDSTATNAKRALKISLSLTRNQVGEISFNNFRHDRRNLRKIAPSLNLNSPQTPTATATAPYCPSFDIKSQALNLDCPSSSTHITTLNPSPKPTPGRTSSILLD